MRDGMIKNKFVKLRQCGEHLVIPNLRMFKELLDLESSLAKCGLGERG